MKKTLLMSCRLEVFGEISEKIILTPESTDLHNLHLEIQDFIQDSVVEEYFFEIDDVTYSDRRETFGFGDFDARSVKIGEALLKSEGVPLIYNAKLSRGHFWIEAELRQLGERS